MDRTALLTKLARWWLVLVAAFLVVLGARFLSGRVFDLENPNLDVWIWVSRGCMVAGILALAVALWATLQSVRTFLQYLRTR